MRGSKQTLLQFAPQGLAPASTGVASATPRATVCGTCRQRFSSDGQFCPFDGQALLAAPDWDPTRDALIGTVIDNRYRVEHVLGTGGMGVVYAVRHTSLGKRFALKALRAELWTEPQVAARFVQEARAAASVRHAGLVEITDFGQLASGQAYFVMEYLEGQPLSQLLRQLGALPAARTIAIARQVADAMHAAHQRGVVHRDLKPGNIHVASDAGFGDRVKVVDFGLAHVAGTSRLTRAGMVYGTPHYMSPEQAAGEMADPRSDIYSLGVVMYQMITGRLPFEADTYLGVLSMHLYATPEHPRKFSENLAGFGAIEAIILRCLEKNPADRYPSLKELIDDLAEQTAEASAVRLRHSVSPSEAWLLSPDPAMTPNDAAGEGELQPAPGRTTPLWLKLAVVAAAVVASVSVAVGFRPSHEPAAAPSANLAAATPSSAASPVGSPRQAEIAVPPGTLAAPTAAAQPPSLPAAAAPSARVGRRVTAPSSQKRPASARGGLKPRASEIVDPWRK